MNASDSLRALAAFGGGLALGVCLALAAQSETPADAARKCERLAGLERSGCERKLVVAEEQREKNEPRSKSPSELDSEANASDSDALDPPRD